MKDVMLSIRPSNCESLFISKQQIHLRKTRPKTHEPFKCYIYCTKEKAHNTHGHLKDSYDYLVLNTTVQPTPFLHFFETKPSESDNSLTLLNGKVIGELIVSGISEYFYIPENLRSDNTAGFAVSKDDLYAMRMTYKDFINYAGCSTVYGWHITDLKLYNNPLDLSSFKEVLHTKSGGKPWRKELALKRAPQDWYFCSRL